MRILVLASEYPVPQRTGGSHVTFNHIIHLSEQHRVYFICTGSEKKTDNFSKRLYSVFFTASKKSRSIWRLPSELIKLFSGVPIFISREKSVKVHELIKKTIREEKIDLALAFGMSSIQNIPEYFHAKTILNIEDPQSIRFRRIAELNTVSKTEEILHRITARAAEAYERRFLHKIARALLLSEADVSDMRRTLQTENLFYIPYGTRDTSSEKIPSFEKREEDSIVFSGTMSHPANIDAAIYFLLEIFPVVLEKKPFANLWIVGANPDKKILSAAKRFGERVTVTGIVPEISEYLNRARVSVCPVRLRIGVQTKVLEALAIGLPVVTTVAGASGIASSPDFTLRAAQDAGRFADYVVEILEGKNWQEISDQGREFVRTHHSWELSNAILDSIISSLVQNINQIN